MHQSAKQVVMRSCETLGVDVTFGSRKSRLGEWHPLSYWLSGGCYPVTLSHKRGPGWGTRDSVSGAEAGGEKAWFREQESGGCAPGNTLFCFPDLALGKVPSGVQVSISHLPGGSELFSGGLASGEGAHHLPAAQMSLGSITGHLLWPLLEASWEHCRGWLTQQT